MSKYIEVATRRANAGMAFIYDLQANYSIFTAELVAVIAMVVLL
jgi:hypothetical protein